jgi:hypothetical protein
MALYLPKVCDDAGDRLAADGKAVLGEDDSAGRVTKRGRSQG